MDREITREQVDDLARVNALKPGREEFRKMPGYYEKEKAEGGYDWGAKYAPNDGATTDTRKTKQANEVGDLFKPFARAHEEYNAKWGGGPGSFGGRGRGRRVARIRGGVFQVWNGEKWVDT